jgi:hypothetical protein
VFTSSFSTLVYSCLILEFYFRPKHQLSGRRAQNKCPQAQLVEEDLGNEEPLSVEAYVALAN